MAQLAHEQMNQFIPELVASWTAGRLNVCLAMLADCLDSRSRGVHVREPLMRIQEYGCMAQQDNTD